MIAIVVAYSDNFAIGKGGKIPWHIPEDLARFAKITKGGTVIMGRKTWESLPEKVRPLPDRNNLVVTSKPIDGVLTFDSLPKAIMFAELKFAGDIFLIGGQGIYEEGLQYATKVHATEVSILVEDADAFFPNLHNSGEWKCSFVGGVRHYPSMANNYGGIDYRFISYEKTADRLVLQPSIL
jgi:dihydrofolate reductase